MSLAELGELLGASSRRCPRRRQRPCPPSASSRCRRRSSTAWSCRIPTARRGRRSRPVDGQVGVVEGDDLRRRPSRRPCERRAVRARRSRLIRVPPIAEAGSTRRTRRSENAHPTIARRTAAGRAGDNATGEMSSGIEPAGSSRRAAGRAAGDHRGDRATTTAWVTRPAKSVRSCAPMALSTP